jgi:hypothetical protein
MTTDGEEEEDKEESSEVKISHCFTNEIPLRVKVVNDPPEREQRMSARRKRERTRTSLVLSTGVDFDFLLPILSLLTLTLRKMPKGKFRSWIFRVLNPTWLPMHLSLLDRIVDTLVRAKRDTQRERVRETRENTHALAHYTSAE